MKIFVTGGMGYIGSHTVLALLERGYEVTILDNLEFSQASTLDRISGLAGNKSPIFIKGDLKNIDDIRKSLDSSFDAVVHFAGYKNVSESIKDPYSYYNNNINGTLNLLKVMTECGVFKMVFSSSCSVYGQPKELPLSETAKFDPLSPYARTKLACEYLIEDFKNVGINSVKLRYFNAAGAHPSGQLGEDPNVILNVIPRMFPAIYGKYKFKLFGNSFNTKDGSQVRDYVHVVDLANAHIKAIEYLNKNNGSFAFNIGTGSGTSNLELIAEIEKVVGKKLEYEVVAPVYGDPIEVYSDVTKSKSVLGWESVYNYKDIIRDSYNWYKQFYE